MKEFFSSQKFKRLLFAVIAIAGAFLIFGLGVATGYRKALFSSSAGRNYYRNFVGDSRRGPLHGFDESAPDTHGVIGSVIATSSSGIILRDGNNDERSVAIASGTIIRKADETISVSMIEIGDQIAAIGAPNADGQVLARFVRVF